MGWDMQLRQSLQQLLTNSNQQPSSIPAVLQCDTEHWLYQSVATLSTHALYQQLIVIIFLLTPFRNCTAYITCVHLHKPCRLYLQKKRRNRNKHTYTASYRRDTVGNTSIRFWHQEQRVGGASGAEGERKPLPLCCLPSYYHSKQTSEQKAGKVGDNGHPPAWEEPFINIVFKVKVKNQSQRGQWDFFNIVTCRGKGG